MRYLHEMLGHAKLGTIQIYTHPSTSKLQAVQATTHPAAKLQRRERYADGLAEEA